MNKVLIGALIPLAAFFFGLLLEVHADSSTGPSKTDRPLQLFEQAHSLSTQLSAPDHPFALVTLLINSKDVLLSDQYRDQYKYQYAEWCREAWRQSPEIRDGWDRVANEKNALVYLSYAAPMEALRKYKEIENPQPQQDGSFPEDTASNGTITVFKNVWESQPSDAARLQVLPELKNVATWLSQRKKGEKKIGEYPYAGMAFILKELNRIGTDEAKQQAVEIYKEAVTSYEQGLHTFLNRNKVFGWFLQETKTTIPDPSLVSQAVQVFVDKVLQTPEDAEMDYESDIRTPKGTAHFNDDRKELLFRSFLMIKEFAPKAAADLRRTRPDLDKATAEKDMEFFPGGYVPKNYDARVLKELHDKIRQYEAVKRIRKMQEADWDAALTLAAALKNEAMHVQGYSALLPTLSKRNFSKAQQLYYGECTRMQELTDASDHLKAAVALAKGSTFVQDTNSFSQLTRVAFQEGQWLFEGDSRFRPEWPVSGRRGYADLEDLTTFATSQDVNLVDSQIQQIDNVSLKSNLLSIEGRALFRQASPSKP